MTVPIKIVEPATLADWGLPVDSATGALETITYAHHEIHSGSSYTAHFTNTTTNDNDHRSCIGFRTPSGPTWFHMIIAVSVSSPGEVFFLEGPATIDLDEGTEATVYNRNRNTSKTSTMLSLESPAVPGLCTTFTEAQINGASLTGGTSLEHRTIATGGGPQAVGGAGRGAEEWLLKSDTIYLVTVQNIGANINLHHINLDWYEHENR